MSSYDQDGSMSRLIAAHSNSYLFVETSKPQRLSA